MAALQAKGYALYVPFSENTRCDLILDREGTLIRVQCKTGRLRKGAVLGALRVDPPRNNQLQRIRLAADYEIGRVAIEGLRASSGA